MGMTNKESTRKKHVVIRKIVMYVLIAVFFLTVVFFFYSMLYKKTVSGVRNTVKLNATESADQINAQLSKRINILTLTAYTLDNMIRDNHSNKEILDYLVNESTSVKDSLIEDSTGIYGYIKGEYMDGSGWVPDEGYNPTERPWYITGKSGNGRIMMVDPYTDLDTGTRMTAITKTLCDTKSVIGMDMSMNDIQWITEEHISNGFSNVEYIVNDKGLIVAHSDNTKVCKYEDESKDSLETAIAKERQSAKDDQFDLRFDGKDYMVNVKSLEPDWTYISVINATEEFRGLRIPLYVIVVITVIMVGTLIFFMVRSDRRSREINSLEIKSERAMAASEAKSSFLSNMSHEIRTPINAILGMNEMVLRESNDDSILSYSENIKNAGNTLLGLINDILDFSKIEAGKIEIIPVEYDMSSVINDLVNMIDARADAKGLKLEMDFDENLPRYLKGDEVRIKQIITNILTNAVKYTEEGGVTFKIGYSEVAYEPNMINLKVSVKDTGIGIKEEDIKKLFLQFERIEESRNRNIEGTGLGMNITKNLLEMMGSELEVSSIYGTGSTFSFTLKQEVVKWVSLGDYKASYKAHVNDRKKYKESLHAPDARVLMVDDNPMNLVVFKNLIKQTEINVDTADNGDDGLYMTQYTQYDMIFLDHMMPGKDGIETLHGIKAQSKGLNVETPAVCLTANAISGAREEYLTEGFDDYLSKPIDPDKLEKMLIHYLPQDKVEITMKKGETATGELSEKLSFLKGQDKIVVSEGLKTSGSVDEYMELMGIFYNSIDDNEKMIGGFYDEKDYKNYTIKVHALKSSARLIGAIELADEAQRLENAGKSDDIDYIESHHDDFMKEYAKFRQILSVAFDGPVDEADDDKEPADESMLNEAYNEIKTASENLDCDTLDFVIEEMNEYKIPDTEKDLFEKIKSAAAKYEYSEILKLLAENKGM